MYTTVDCNAERKKKNRVNAKNSGPIYSAVRHKDSQHSHTPKKKKKKGLI